LGRYVGPVCKLCRREGVKLFLKGDRCFSDKCGFDKRNYPPGEHGQRTIKLTGYGLQLREKQKLKRIYGVSEKQFRNYFYKADKMKGITGDNLIELLERRLDSVVYKLGLATSRREARILIRHNHFTVNGRKVNIPSFIVREGDVVEVKEKSREKSKIIETIEASQRRTIPEYLEFDKDNFRGIVKRLPKRDEITLPVNEQLIVELYSK
jgi:small subunit ribosomal protein S4